MMKKIQLILAMLGLLAYNISAQSPTARIQMASGEITIDGQVTGATDSAVWSNATAHDILKPFNGDVFAGSADLAGYWKAVYNDTGIFVLVNRTKDNIRYTDGKPGNNYTKDGVEVYFDANDVLKDGGYPGIANGYDGHNNGHYQVAVYNTNTSTPGLAGWCKGCKAAVKGGDTITGVNYPSVEELYVPWTTLQSKQGGAFDPGAGMPLGFDVYLIDNDGGGDGNVKKRKVWSNNGTAGENYTNMDSAGMITFKSEAAIAKATGPITIDGSDTETAWNDANKYDISLHVKSDGDFANAADLSGYWKAAYNDTGIFVTVQTTLDNIRFTGDHATGNSWEKDGLEVYFDMNKTLLDGLGSKDSKGHYQIAVYNVNAATQSPSLPGCKLVVNGGDTTHNVNYPIKSELYVPWKSLKDKYGVSYDPRSGQPFGFDVYLLDNDGGANATPARRRLAWANDKTVDENYSNMDGAGIVKLQGFTRAKAEISKTSTQIKIDGTIEDAWTPATQYNITRPFGSDVFANAADLSGYWKALACDTGIFVLIKTTKDNIRYTGDGKTFGAPWEKDAIEVYFDVNDTLDGLGSGAGTSTGHYAFTVYNVNAATQTPPCAGCQLAVNGADTVSGSNYPITEELFVPWTYLKDKNAKLIKTDGSKLGFDVGLTDNDGGANGTPARRRLMWSNSGAIGENYSNMDDAGILVLPQLAAVQAILVSSIDISGKDTLRVNASTIMSANVLPLNATNANYTWSVSDPSLASISTRGILLGKAVGKVTVTATALDAGGKTGTKTVVIIKAADTKPPILSGVAVDSIYSTYAKAHVTSSENGKMYFGVLLASASSPSADVIKAGTGFLISGNNTIGTVTQTINLSGLTAMTGYSFYVIALDSSGNISDISRVDFSTNNATSVISQRAGNVLIYPNPATDVIRLKNDNTEVTLFIYDVTGQLVLTRNLHGDAEINVSALRSGLYTVKTVSSNGVNSTKLIVKK